MAPHVTFNFKSASERLKGITQETPLQLNANLSRKFGCNVYLKREDLQVVRSYKLRGAYNKMVSLSPQQLAKGVVCASAGNHAQGFAFSCKVLGIKGVVFMPSTTPTQKINQVKMFGGNHITITLTGDTYDDCARAAIAYSEKNQQAFIHPFDDEKVIEGQGTVGVEIIEQFYENSPNTSSPNPSANDEPPAPEIDFLLIPIGGGGLAAGVGSYVRTAKPAIKIIGIEPEGAASMKKAFEVGHPITLETIDRFVDGAAVKRVGDITYAICKEVLDETLAIPEGKVCSAILRMYNKDAIVVEPAGALTIAALFFMGDRIKGKNVVCIVSGSNNDIDRMQEIKERSLQYEGFKHYFLINFAQRPGALKEFVNEVLGPDDDITRFEYMQKTNKEAGPALVGIEIKRREDYGSLIDRMKKTGIQYTELNKNNTLFSYLV